MAQRRAYGSGSLAVKTDSRGRESYYGRWWRDGERIERRLGPKRLEGTADGLTKADAEQALRDAIATVKPRGTGDRIRLSEAAERYLSHLAAIGRKRTTLAGVESACRIWLVAQLGDKRLDAITPQDIDDLIRTMQHQGVSAKSIRNYIGTLSALYGWAMQPRRRYAARNPVEDVDLPGVERHTPPVRFLTASELDALLEHVTPGEHAQLDRALYATAATSGLRQGELIALRWQDVDLGARRVRVERSHTMGEFDSPKSALSARSVPMSARLVAELETWQQTSSWTQRAHLVFAEPVSGEPLRRGALMRRWRRTLKAAGLPPHRFHDLRHTFGTAAAGAGVPMRTLQAWLGHRDIQTTLRYSGYSPSAEEVAMVDRAFG